MRQDEPPIQLVAQGRCAAAQVPEQGQEGQMVEQAYAAEQLDAIECWKEYSSGAGAKRLRWAEHFRAMQEQVNMAVARGRD